MLAYAIGNVHKDMCCHMCKMYDCIYPPYKVYYIRR
nr:MAG TPA: hypothetical protein [Ackermannviridae sp.]